MKHLLSTDGLDADSITAVLDTADELKRTLLGREVRKLPARESIGGHHARSLLLRPADARVHDRELHTAEPRSDDNNRRRMALPNVCPKPRSSGCKRNSAMFGVSSRFVASTSCGRTSPLRSIVFAMIP